jgi:cytochrome P450
MNDAYAALCTDLIESALRALKNGNATAAAAWIMGRSAPIPFDLACDVAGLDPDAVRDRLRRDDRLPRRTAA